LKDNGDHNADQDSDNHNNKLSTFKIVDRISRVNKVIQLGEKSQKNHKIFEIGEYFFCTLSLADVFQEMNDR